MTMNVAILGASDNIERYSNKAFHMLREHHHQVFPVSPKLQKLEGVRVFAKLTDIDVPVHTLTMYVGASISSGLKNEILKLKPQRVIFNPGSENPELQSELSKQGIHIVEACTLVLLRTGQFESA